MEKEVIKCKYCGTVIPYGYCCKGCWGLFETGCINDQDDEEDDDED